MLLSLVTIDGGIINIRNEEIRIVSSSIYLREQVEAYQPLTMTVPIKLSILNCIINWMKYHKVSEAGNWAGPLGIGQLTNL